MLTSSKSSCGKEKTNVYRIKIISDNHSTFEEIWNLGIVFFQLVAGMYRLFILLRRIHFSSVTLWWMKEAQDILRWESHRS